jgi:putative DNA primase/helicase
MTAELLTAALDYAARGFRVLPVYGIREDGRCECGAEPGACKVGKHPVGGLVPHGLKDASSDPAVITAWFAERPESNIAIATGRESGFVGLDLDGPEAHDALFDLEAQHGDIPPTTTANTGRGRHLLFRYPGVPVKNCTALAGIKGIDVKGDSGYLVAPPSRHASGKLYAWAVPPGDAKVPMQPLPPWLLGIINGAPNSNGNGHAPRIETTGAGIPEGQRNAALASLAGTMRKRGMTPAAIEAALVAENAARCNPPLPDGEVRAIVQSVGKYQPAAPPAAVLAELDVLDLIRNGTPSVIMDLEDFLARRTLTYKTGAPKGYKTWAALEMAVCLSTGDDFAGLKVAERRRVLFLEAESWLQIPDRFERLCRGHGVSPAAVLEGVRFIIPNTPLRLERPDHAAALLQAARDFRADWIILDSFVRLHGLDENSSHDMALLANGALLPLRDQGGCGVLVLDHPPKPFPGGTRGRKEQIRGSWEKLAAADVQLHVDAIEADDGGKIAALSVAASRVAPERERPICMQLADTTNGGIRFEAVGAPEPKAKAGRPPTVFQQAVNIIRAEQARDPNLSYTDAVGRCMAAGVGKRTAGGAWTYCKVQEVQK